MESTFQDVPVDKSTKIIAQYEIEINGIKALYQKWSWDGVVAKSIIFNSRDVADMNKKEIIRLINTSEFKHPVVKPSTISRSKSGFTFINFGFKTY